MRVHALRGALAVAMLMIAGCGGSGSSSSSTTAQTSTFRGDFKLTLGQFKTTSHAIGLAVESAASHSDSQIATTFSGLATQWDADVLHLKSLTPPPSVAGEFTTLTAAASKVGGDLKAIVTAANTHDGAAARKDGASLVKDDLAAKTAALAISSKLGLP